MITVYHGSAMAVENPNVDAGRVNLDFGKAFYVTRVEEQAKNWAKVVTSKKEDGVPILNVYQFDLDEALRKGGRYLNFEEYDKEWLDFIVESRRGIKPWQGYDIIEGGVANDRIIDTVEGYMNGDFTVEVAIGRLRYNKPNNQIAILNQQIITDSLHFVEALKIDKI